MLVWINNNFENMPTIFSWLTIGMGLVTICLIPILEEYFWSRVIFFLIFFITLSEVVLLLSPNSCCNLSRALRGEYGQHLVETKQFYANKNTEELQKLSKSENSSTVTVWKGKKKYDAVKVKCREGKEEKIVFTYPEPTVKGIKVNKNKAYIYIYHKKAKPQPKVFKYGEE